MFLVASTELIGLLIGKGSLAGSSAIVTSADGASTTKLSLLFSTILFTGFCSKCHE